MFELSAVVSLFASDVVTFQPNCRLGGTDLLWDRREKRQAAGRGLPARASLSWKKKGPWD